mgnify:CR=1 FL=1
MAGQNKNDDLGKLVKNTKTEEYKEIKMGENMIFFSKIERVASGNCGFML